MKNLKVERRFFTKIAAIVFGLILWVIIINIEDAEFSTRLNNVPIQLSGEITLESNNLIVSNKGDLTGASVSVRGKRSDIINFMSGVYATADVSKITEPGEYNIRLSYDVSINALYVTERKTTTVKIVVEELQRKTVEVIALQEGTITDSNKIIESTPKTKKVEVRGTAADLEKIAYAAALVDISNMSADSEVELPLSAVDEEYKLLDIKNNIYMSTEETNVKNKFYKRVSVPVEIEVKTASNNAFVIASQSVTTAVVGVSDDTELTALKAVLNYDEAQNGEYIAEIEQPKGVYIPREYKQVTVSLKTAPKVSGKVTVALSVQSDENQKVSAPEQVEIELSGAAELINSANVTAAIDVRGYDAGTHDVPITVDFKTAGAEVTGKPKVTVNIE